MDGQVTRDRNDEKPREGSCLLILVDVSMLKPYAITPQKKGSGEE